MFGRETEHRLNPLHTHSRGLQGPLAARPCNPNLIRANRYSQGSWAPDPASERSTRHHLVLRSPATYAATLATLWPASTPARSCARLLGGQAAEEPRGEPTSRLWQVSASHFV